MPGRPIQKPSTKQGAELMGLMKRLGFSARKLGRELEMPTTTVTRWLSGRNRVSADRAVTLCKLAIEHKVELPDVIVLICGEDAEAIKGYAK